MFRQLSLKFVIIATLAFALILVSRQARAAATFVVNGSSDMSDADLSDGACDTLPYVPGDQCSLRAAFEQLNQLGPEVDPHLVEFNLPGPGPIPITFTSPLPMLTVPVVIDGISQPGSHCPSSNSPATLNVVLDGTLAGIDANGLALTLGANGSKIRGLTIINFDGNGIDIAGADSVEIVCNHIGVGTDGLTAGSNETGIKINAEAVQIGGALARHRNVISGQRDAGIHLIGTDFIVQSNFVGTSADGTVAVGNLVGIRLFTSNTFIGGLPSRQGVGPAGNLISGNLGQAIYIGSGANNVIQSNVIGLARDGVSPLGNGSYGIQIASLTTDTTIGGAGLGNMIAHNHSGIFLSDAGNSAHRNEISRNAIFANRNLGIDLYPLGVSFNDIPLDPDVGPNHLQNFPVLDSIENQQIHGHLDSEANKQYRVEFYGNSECDYTGYGEAKTYLGYLDVTTDSQGTANFSFGLAMTPAPGTYFTATATDPDGSTSEISACLEPALVPTPTSTATATNTPTATPTPSQTPAATHTATPSHTPTGTLPPSATATATPTNTGTAAYSPTPSSTPTMTLSPTPTATASNTATPAATATPFIPADTIFLPVVRRLP